MPSADGYADFRRAQVTPIVHVVIPVFNGWPQTRRCLDALRASQYPSLRILVVDHGSTDDTEQALATSYPEVRRVVGEPVLWWSGATNLGIRTALAESARLIMLLNNDCYLLPGAIDSMLGQLEKLGLALVAPMQRDLSSGEISSAGISTCLLLGYPSIEIRPPQRNSGVCRVPLIAGGRGVLIPADVFESVGLMDETNLPHYAADHDFYLRCRKHGIPLYVDSNAVIDVDNARTSLANRLGEMSFTDFRRTLVERRSHRNVRDLRAFFKKHYPLPGLHDIGVALNVARYFASYAVKRAVGLTKHSLGVKRKSS